jgi:peptidoglycan hydrolase-like protein with peptidoglycan-binding domain
MSRILKIDTRGPDVGDLQRRLNCQTPTRLPRLKPDNHYGVRTMARVMEFQFLRSLTIDGAAGSITLGKLSGGSTVCPNASPPSLRCILVDLINNRLFAFNNGIQQLLIKPIRGGSATDPSTRGVFQMSNRRLRHHTSAEFPDPPDNMQFALFYHKGEAIHMGPPNEPSHGCIHVGEPDAEQVFNFAGPNNDVLVIVVKLTR